MRFLKVEDGTLEATITVKLKPNPKDDGNGFYTWDAATTFPDGSTKESRFTTYTEDDAVVMALLNASEDWEERVNGTDECDASDDEEDDGEDDEDEEEEDS